MELHFQYFERVQGANRTMEDDDEDEEEIYLRKLEAGLYTLQLIDYIIIEIASATSEIPSIRQRVLQILNLRNSSIDTIKGIVRGKICSGDVRFGSSPSRSSLEYAENLGTGKKTNGVDHSSSTDGNSNGNQDDSYKQHLLDIIEKF